MSNTGAPWNIPYVDPTDLVVDYPAADEAQAEAVAAALNAAGNAFDDSIVITATNNAFAVPALGNPIVRMTVVGAGGGAPGARGAVGGNGGTSSVIGTGVSVSAVGGSGATRTNSPVNIAGQTGAPGLRSANGGEPGRENKNESRGANLGFGGQIVVEYVDLSAVSTLNVTIGAGGAGSSGSSGANGGAGGRGEVIIEFKAA